MFHISIWGDLELCLGGLSPPRPLCGDGTGLKSGHSVKKWLESSYHYIVSQRDSRVESLKIVTLVESLNRVTLSLLISQECTLHTCLLHETPDFTSSFVSCSSHVRLNFGATGARERDVSVYLQASWHGANR